MNEFEVGDIVRVDPKQFGQYSGMLFRVNKTVGGTRFNLSIIADPLSSNRTGKATWCGEGMGSYIHLSPLERLAWAAE